MKYQDEKQNFKLQIRIPALEFLQDKFMYVSFQTLDFENLSI